MTELALNEPQTAAVAAYAPPANGPGVDLSSYYNRMSVALQIANGMCNTPFVPTAFRGKAEDTAMAIMYGFKYNMEPDAALAAIFMIGGRPGMYSRVQHAILLANGHEVVITKQAMDECIVEGRRKGTEKWTTSTWTTARAEQAGYFSNAKYKTDPIAMLTARAIGDVCRLVAPDLLMGIVAYNEADIEPLQQVVYDGDTLEPVKETVTRPVVTARPGLSVVRPFAETPAPAEPEPLSQAEAAVDAEVVEEGPEPVQTGELVSQEIAGVLNAMLTELGVRTKAGKLKAAADFAGRELTSVMDLSADEANSWGRSLRSTLDAKAAALQGTPEPAPAPAEPAPIIPAEPELDSWGLPITNAGN
jgi:hypothetical protein